MTAPGAIDFLKQIDEDQEVVIDGQTITETVHVGDVIRAARSSDGSEYIRLQYYDDRTTYRWNADIALYNALVVNDDPDDILFDARWEAE